MVIKVEISMETRKEFILKMKHFSQYIKSSEGEMIQFEKGRHFGLTYSSDSKDSLLSISSLLKLGFTRKMKPTAMATAPTMIK